MFSKIVGMQIRSRSSIRSAWLIGVVGFGVLFVSAVFSTYAAPAISWQPENVTATISAGGSNTIPVTFTASANLAGVSIRVVPALQSFVKVEPASFGAISKGQATQVNLILHPSAITLPQTVEGTIQVRSTSDPNKNLARPLPVSLTVTWATFSNAASGIEIKYPDFGAASAVDVTPGIAGGTMFDIKFQLLPDTNFISGFGVLLIPNPTHLTLADWFHQNIDQKGALMAAGTFASTNVNGMDALFLSGAIPDSDIEESGPVAAIYAMSLSQNTVVVLSKSQVSELDTLGLTADQQKEMLRQVLANLQVP